MRKIILVIFAGCIIFLTSNAMEEKGCESIPWESIPVDIKVKILSSSANARSLSEGWKKLRFARSLEEVLKRFKSLGVINSEIRDLVNDERVIRMVAREYVQNHPAEANQELLSMTSDNPELAKALLEGGVELDIRDNNGRTPLFRALGGGHYDVAKLLIDNGADINETTPDGIHMDLKLLFSADNRANELIKFVIEHKMNNIDADLGDGYTPLMYVATRASNEDFELARLLLEKGANPNVLTRDAKPKTALRLVNLRRKGQPAWAIRKLLLEKGANENI